MSEGAGFDLSAYFARLGYDGPAEASLPTLRRLHALHAAAIPFENIDVLLDRGVSLEPADVAAKLIHRRRGGYCFEQNGLFQRVLETLGFEVEGHVARVVWQAPADAPERPRTHKVLRVRAEDETWLCDVGFGGCVLPEPLRWSLDVVQETRHDRYRLRQDGAEIVQEVERDGIWQPAYRIGAEAQHDVDYLLPNWWTSTHPSSHFRHNLIVARTAHEARYALLNNRLVVRPVGAPPERRELDVDGVLQVLSETFGLPVGADWRPGVERAVALGAP